MECGCTGHWHAECCLSSNITPQWTPTKNQRDGKRWCRCNWGCSGKATLMSSMSVITMTLRWVLSTWLWWPLMATYPSIPDPGMALLALDTPPSISTNDSEMIQINNIMVTEMVGAFLIIILCSSICPNKCRILCCQVDTSAGRNNLSLDMFHKLFSDQFLSLKPMVAQLSRTDNSGLDISGTPVKQRSGLFRWTVSLYVELICKNKPQKTGPLTKPMTQPTIDVHHLPIHTK